jgi:hypothetical protein
MVIRWTGFGWLTFFLFIATIGFSAVIGQDLFQGQIHGLGIVATVAAIFGVLGFVLQFGIGRLCNRGTEVGTPWWRGIHTFEGVQMQFLAWVYPALAAVGECVVLGQTRGALWGWLAFAVAVGVGVGVGFLATRWHSAARERAQKRFEQRRAARPAPPPASA